MYYRLKNKTSFVVLSLLLTACGGGNNDSSGASTSPTGSTSPSNDALAANVFSALAMTSKAIDSAKDGINKSKFLSSTRYKATTQTVACNGGGEQRITGGDIDPSSGQMPTSIDFSVVFDNCKNTQNGTESFINGSLTMTIELNQSDPAVGNSDYIFTISNAHFIDSNIAGKTERVDIKNYELKASGNQDKNTMQINGSFKESTCLNQWITLKTLSPIVQMTNNTCPTAGQMSMTISQTTTTVTYNEDQSIDISGNGTSQHYDNCNDLSNIDDSNMCK